MPALRQITATGVPSSPCYNTNAFCASVNLDAFMVPLLYQPGKLSRKLHLQTIQFLGGEQGYYPQRGIGQRLSGLRNRTARLAAEFGDWFKHSACMSTAKRGWAKNWPTSVAVGANC